jgi:hypothetical protein
MNRQIIFRAMAAGAVILTVNFSAQAQVGGALNRARNAAQQTVQGAGEQAKQSAEDVKQSAGQTVNEATGQVTGETGQQNTGGQAQPAGTTTGAQQPRQDGKPSAAAIAADPLASDNEVARNYSRSPAQIRAAYEALDPKVYFKPYYHPQLKNYYWLDNTQSNYFTVAGVMLNEHLRRVHREAFLNSSGQISFWPVMTMAGNRYSMFMVDTIPAGNRGLTTASGGYMPIGAHVMYAGLALYAADPYGYIPFMRFCEAKIAQQGLNVAYPTNEPANAWDGQSIPLPDGGKSQLPFRWRDIMNTDLQNEIERLEGIARNETPVAVIKSAAAVYYDNIRKHENSKSNYGLLRYNFHLFSAAMHYWMNSAKKVDDPDFNALWGEYQRLNKLYPQFAELEVSGGDPVDMPRTVDMGADLTAKALAAAKRQFAGTFNVDRVVFFTNTWVEYKEANWPHRIMHRSVDAGLLTNNDGKWLVRYFNFQQYSDQKGGWTENFGFTAGAKSGNAQRVNYTP